MTSRAHTLQSGRGAQAGASLLEVLISVLILAIGLLGIAALQSVSLRNTLSSEARTAAVIQSYAMLDMMRANRNSAIEGDYDQGWLCEAPDPSGDRINDDLNVWISQLQDAMGESACGRITCTVLECEVGVRWNDSRSSGGVDEQEITTVSRL